ncbi:50S ribosomal protein L11 methyltransferase [Selenihalanaerobacter shriftii]|uniref:Ribosomal protein L11 methyltransferase n=1 Tax=Selenihalanaerobacter shriftii TaxID=142842 RepID=A0A1T4PY48_9FIRM|nr:50S ribosomal protein L11 methyltransferase [Selenihalanaerobacter shriftii]SJZ96480.1 ribosomal protein L11 methyltransferase [Selenihalanaerobacter shriftii]
MEWVELKIFSKDESLPAIDNILREIGTDGLIQEEIVETIESEDNLLIKSYLPVNDSFESKLVKLKSRIGQLTEYGLDVGSGKVELETIPEEEWSTSWKQYFKPERITKRIVVKPTWEDYQPQSGEEIIDLNPGMAFGIGSHATTTMCIEAIEDYYSQCQNMLDIGTGTGILSIVANLLQIKNILAIDIDEVAIKVAKDNLKLNGIEDKVVVKQGDLVNTVEEKYDLVVANILPHIIKELIPDILKVLHEDSIFVLSGIIDEKEAEIKDKLKELGLKIKEIKYQEEWVTIIGERRE